MLNETVQPFFEAHEARVYTILSDNEREFCGRPDHHPYELFLQLEGIERRPQSNGFIERLHRTLQDEHFRIKGRTTWYESVEQMQTDLDNYLEHDNNQRPHQGRMICSVNIYRINHVLNGLVYIYHPVSRFYNTILMGNHNSGNITRFYKRVYFNFTISI